MCLGGGADREGTPLAKGRRLCSLREYQGVGIFAIVPNKWGYKLQCKR
jgi:hypothetical protein